MLKINFFKDQTRLYEHLTVPELCSDCQGPLFSDAYLWKHFGHPICNNCRFIKYLKLFKNKFHLRESEKHKLITRTEAKKYYLLTDGDLDFRKPLLRFISRKNPHNPRYGDMKLYLRSQVFN